jgi:hypothetical protein
MKKTFCYLILFIFIVSGSYLGMLTITPKNIPKATSPEDFSLTNQMQHIKAMASKPHPVGSEEHTRVRDYLMEELSRLGLNPEIQETISTYNPWKLEGVTKVQNIIARRKGGENTKALLLMAHYDTKPLAPGANDDTAGVAAILETLRILKEGISLKNDLIILFSDAEELGLRGAHSFFSEHPWAQEIGFVLNLEARGSSGTSIMFETGPDNAWQVRGFAASVQHSVGISITNAVYQTMPNDTDFTIFKEAGLPGLNFGYIDSWDTYHMPTDNIEHLDPRTLYHQGSTILEATEYFGNLDLRDSSEGEAVYFNVLRSWMIIYPQGWAWILAAAAGMLLIGTIVLAGIRKRVNWKGILIGFFGSGFVTFIIILLVSSLLKLLELYYGEAFNTFTKYRDFRNFFLLGFVVLAAGAFFLILRLLVKWSDVPSLSSGALLWWLLGVIGAVVYLQGASYLLTWPLVLGTTALIIVLGKSDSEMLPVGKVFLLALISLPLLILFVPVFYMINTAFPMSGMIFGTLGLFLVLFIPHLVAITKKNYLRLAVFLLLAGAGITAFGLFTHKAKNYSRLNSVIYYLNSDAGKASLAVQSLNDWTGRFMENAEYGSLFGDFPKEIGEYFIKSAPQAPIAPPEMQLILEKVDAGNRILEANISSPRHCYCIKANIKSKGPISSATIGEKEIQVESLQKVPGQPETEGYEYDLFLYTPGEKGYDISFVFEGTDPVEFKLIDLSYDLPDDIMLPDPPPYVMTGPETHVSKSFVF